jgi:hypothetical protein
MSLLLRRLAGPLSALAFFGLTSCGRPVPTTASVRTSDFYWAAARETWAAGDYIKTADHLHH